VGLLRSFFSSRFSVRVHPSAIWSRAANTCGLHLVLWLCLLLAYFGVRDMAGVCVCCCAFAHVQTGLLVDEWRLNSYPHYLVGPGSYVADVSRLVVVRPVGAAPVRCVYSRPGASPRAGYILYSCWLQHVEGPRSGPGWCTGSVQHCREH
jgi:hypothetical protein